MTDSDLPAAIPTPDARDRVVERLSKHFADDGMTLDEFERRMELVYKATDVAALDALVADAPAPVALTSVAPAKRAIATAGAPDSLRIVSVLSNNERGGLMIVPRHLRIVSIFGNVELDLRHASFGEGVTEIHVRAVFGNVEITLPAGVRVENSGEGFLANFTSRGGSVANAEIVVRIGGRAIMANVEAWTADVADDDGDDDDEPRKLSS